MLNSVRRLGGLASILLLTSGCGAGQRQVASERQPERSDITTTASVVMVEGSSMYAFSSLEDLSATSDLIVEVEVDGSRFGKEVVSGVSSQTPRFLEMKVVSILKGLPPERLSVYDANREINEGRDYSDPEAKPVLAVYTDLEIKVGDRLVAALSKDDSVEPGAYTFNTPSGFFPLSADGSEQIQAKGRRNPIATEAQKLTVDELRERLMPR